MFPNLAGVINNSAVELIDVVEALVLEPGRGFFAANATGTVEKDFAVLLSSQQARHLLQFFAEGVHIREEGPFEVADFAFVMVAHVHYQGSGFFHGGVEFGRVEVASYLGGIKSRVVDSVGYDFGTDFEG